MKRSERAGYGTLLWWVADLPARVHPSPVLRLPPNFSACPLAPPPAPSLPPPSPVWRSAYKQLEADRLRGEDRPTNSWRPIDSEVRIGLQTAGGGSTQRGEDRPTNSWRPIDSEVRIGLQTAGGGSTQRGEDRPTNSWRPIDSEVRIGLQTAGGGSTQRGEDRPTNSWRRIDSEG